MTEIISELEGFLHEPRPVRSEAMHNRIIEKLSTARLEDLTASLVYTYKEDHGVQESRSVTSMPRRTYGDEGYVLTVSYHVYDWDKSVFADFIADSEALAADNTRLHKEAQRAALVAQRDAAEAEIARINAELESGK